MASDAPPAEGVEPPAGSELLRPQKDAEAVILALSKAIGDGAVAQQLSFLKGHVLPFPAGAMNLLYAAGCLLGVDPASLKDVCGDVSWENIRMVCIYCLCRLFPQIS
jgi:hypothetical protein